MITTLLTVVTVGGCATAMTGRSSTSIPIADSAPPVTFLIPKVSSTGRLNSQKDIVTALLENMSRQIPDLGTLPSSPGFGPDTNSVGGIRFVFMPQTSSFEASWKWQQALNRNFLTASIPLTIRDKGTAFEVTLKCASTMNSDIVNFSLVGIPKWSNDKIGAHLTAACMAGPAAARSLT